MQYVLLLKIFGIFAVSFIFKKCIFLKKRKGVFPDYILEIIENKGIQIGLIPITIVSEEGKILHTIKIPSKNFPWNALKKIPKRHRTNRILFFIEISPFKKIKLKKITPLPLKEGDNPISPFFEKY